MIKDTFKSIMQSTFIFHCIAVVYSIILNDYMITFLVVALERRPIGGLLYCSSC